MGLGSAENDHGPDIVRPLGLEPQGFSEPGKPAERLLSKAAPVTGWNIPE